MVEERGARDFGMVLVRMVGVSGCRSYKGASLYDTDWSILQGQYHSFEVA